MKPIANIPIIRIPLLLGALGFIGLVTFATTLKKGNNGSEVLIEVVLSYDQCATDPAVYQVLEDRRMKITDLQRMNSDAPGRSHFENVKEVYNAFEQVGLDPDQMVEHSAESLEDGSRIIQYAYQGQ